LNAELRGEFLRFIIEHPQVSAIIIPEGAVADSQPEKRDPCLGC